MVTGALGKLLDIAQKLVELGQFVENELAIIQLLLKTEGTVMDLHSNYPAVTLKRVQVDLQ